MEREAPIQRAIVDWLRLVMPDAIIHHSKNEINKRGTAIARELAKAKRQGVVTGFPDLIVLPYSHVGAVFFEVKAPGRNATEIQKETHEKLRKLGYRVAVVRSIDDARDRLQEWGIGFREVVHVRASG